MDNLIKKTFFATIGIACLTKDKIEDIGKKLSKEADLKEEDGKKFIEELLKKSKEARGSLEKVIRQNVEFVLKKLDIPIREEINALEKRINLLENNNSEMK